MPDKKHPKSVVFKRTTLAAAIALTFATPAALAAPSSNQLPGHGAVTSGSVTSSNQNVPQSGPETITLGQNTVITWGGTATPTINTGQPAGFNIGSNAALNFTGGQAVLNVDASGNASRIMGHLTNNGDLFVANGNGIIVTGSNARIQSTSGMVGLIGESGSSLKYGSTLSGSTYDGISFNGTQGGNVTIGKNSQIGGTGTTRILVAGGGNVNVGDLAQLKASGGTGISASNAGVVITAGQPSPNSGTFAANNTNAVLTVAGTVPNLTDFETAGNLVTTGTTDLVAEFGLSVGTTLKNQGILDLQDPTQAKFNIVNNGTINVALTGHNTIVNSLSPFTIVGNLTNNGQIRIDSDADPNKTNGAGFPLDVQGGNLTNKGTINAGYDLSQNSAFQPSNDIFNQYFASSTSPTTGKPSTSPSSVPFRVTNGHIVNKGTMAHIASLDTASNTGLPSFTSGADYSINNSGQITGLMNYGIDANYANRTGSNNDSQGSFTNTGVVSVTSHSGNNRLSVFAQNNLNLKGQVEVKGKQIASQPLSNFTLQSRNGGVLLAAPLTFTGGPNGTGVFKGQNVVVRADVSGVKSRSNSKPAGSVTIQAGAKPKSGYAVRIAQGDTVSAHTVSVLGQAPAGGMYANPNVILQGQLSGHTIQLGGTQTGAVPQSGTQYFGAVNDVFSGPKGGLVATGLSPTVTVNFTGRIKTAHYLNDPSNFRYNDLLIASKNPVTLNLNPVAYQTNGTTGVSNSGKPSAVNILVNNSVTLKGKDKPASVPTAGGSSVTGIDNWPNTHLVLQSTGNITLRGASQNTFYWPGLVYLGTIDTMNGQPAPGTLNSFGQIIAKGNLNNVLPGNTAKGGGMHLETGQPVNLNGHQVVTNAMSWVNFASAKYTNHYASTKNVFYGGSKGSGNVVNYNQLPTKDFHTQLPYSQQ